MYSSKIRNIELPENLFSNLGEMKSKKINAQEDLKHYEDPSSIEDKSNEISTKMTNFSKHKEYRNRINQMYEGMKEITPIDTEIDNVVILIIIQKKVL